MDRVHRIGQTKKVSVVRLVSANSVENRILAIQEAKQALGKGALRKVGAAALVFRILLYWINLVATQRGGGNDLKVAR